MTASYKSLLLPSPSSGRDQPHSDAGMKPKRKPWVQKARWIALKGRNRLGAHVSIPGKALVGSHSIPARCPAGPFQGDNSCGHQLSQGVALGYPVSPFQGEIVGSINVPSAMPCVVLLGPFSATIVAAINCPRAMPWVSQRPPIVALKGRNKIAQVNALGFAYPAGREGPLQWSRRYSPGVIPVRFLKNEHM